MCRIFCFLALLFSTCRQIEILPVRGHQPHLFSRAPNHATHRTGHSAWRQPIAPQAASWSRYHKRRCIGWQGPNDTRRCTTTATTPTASSSPTSEERCTSPAKAAAARTSVECIAGFVDCLFCTKRCRDYHEFGEEWEWWKRRW